MKKYRSLIQKDNIPGHVAIIMDGNGRWAQAHSLSRSEGHKKGADVIEPLIDSAIELGVKAVSLYAFSAENWTRPKMEIRSLWRLLEIFFRDKLPVLMENDIRIFHSGSLKRLPPSTKSVINNALEKTRTNSKLYLNFCINYGGRQEIISAVNTWLEKRKNTEKLTESRLEKELYTSDLPGVDLLIRTSGEYRLSNFLVWQLAYSELVFMDVLWPDFKPWHFYKAVYEYQQRSRRFGGL